MREWRDEKRSKYMKRLLAGYGRPIGEMACNLPFRTRGVEMSRLQ